MDNHGRSGYIGSGRPVFLNIFNHSAIRETIPDHVSKKHQEWELAGLLEALGESCAA